MSLSDKFLAFEIFGGIGTLMVIIGLVLEYGAEILWDAVKFVRLVFECLTFRRKQRLHPAKIETETLSKRAGAVCVVFGIVFELIGTAGVAVTSRQIETQHQREIATFQSLLAWRSLGVEQQQAIGKACNGPPGPKPVLMESLNNDAEAYFLGQDIIGALSLAKPAIQVIDRRGSMLGDWAPSRSTTLPFTGVGIMGPTTEHDFMKRLSRALESEGRLKNVVVLEEPRDPKTGKPTGGLYCWIVVGPKPIERPRD